MSFVVQVLSLQAEELQAKRRELADLRCKVVEKELELSTAKALRVPKKHFRQRCFGGQGSGKDIQKGLPGPGGESIA